MNLPTVAYRQLRGDIVTTFLAVSNLGSPTNHIYVLNVGTKTRRHSYKLKKESFRSLTRQYFLSNRVFNVWNSLPDYIIKSSSHLSFKMNFDKYMGDDDK